MEFMSAGVLKLLWSLTSLPSTDQRSEVEKERECRKKVEDKMQEPSWKREKVNTVLADWGEALERTGERGIQDIYSQHSFLAPGTQWRQGHSSLS